MIKSTKALQLKIENLVRLANIAGDLHVHTTYSDGLATVKEIVELALDRKYQYIGITDHSIGQVLANGLDEDRVKQQWEEIDQAQETYGPLGIKIYKATECEVDKDGKIDWSDDMLTKFDYVIISPTHRGQNNLEARLTKAIEHLHGLGVFTIVGHATGRQFGKTGFPEGVNWDAIFDLARKRNVVFEINSTPQRLDLPDFLARKASAHKVKIAINTDAHDPNTLNAMSLGIGIARRAALIPFDIINCHLDPLNADASDIYERPVRERKLTGLFAKGATSNGKTKKADPNG